MRQVEAGRNPQTGAFWVRVTVGAEVREVQVPKRPSPEEVEALAAEAFEGRRDSEVRGYDGTGPVPEIVGLLTQGIPGGGAEKSTLNLLQALPSRSGLAVTATHQSILERSVPSRFRAMPLQAVANLAEARVLVDDGSGLLGTKIPAPRPFVQTVRNSVDSTWEQIAQQAPLQRVYTSTHLAKTYRGALRQADVVIPNGVPIPPWGAVVPSGRDGVALVSRLTKSKGLPAILAAIGNLEGVTVAGAGPLLEELQETYPKVDFRGYVEEVSEVYAEAGIAIAWTDYAEGFWRVPFEAMARGCALVGRGSGDLAPWASSAWLQPAERPADLGRAIRDLRADPKTLQRLQAASIHLSYSWDERIARTRWRWLLQRLLGETPDTPRFAVGIPWGGANLQHLAYCLQGLKRQTIPVEVYVLADTVTAEDAEVARQVVKDVGSQAKVLRVDYDRTAGANRAKVRNLLFTAGRGADILAWADGDTLVPCDWAETVAAMLEVYPQGAISFMRRRVNLPETFPVVTHSASLEYDLPQVEEPPGGARKDEQMIVRGISKLPHRKALLWLGVGPLTAARAAVCPRWDESFVKWGGEELDWWYTLAQRGGPVLVGPAGYHLEHDLPETLKERAASNEVNLQQLYAKHGIPA